MPEPDATFAELAAAGLVEVRDGRRCTTRRWQAAMARAAAHLHDAGAPWTDLRLPVVAALLELLPPEDDEALVRHVSAMLSVEAGELTRGRDGGGTEPAQPRSGAE